MKYEKLFRYNQNIYSIKIIVKNEKEKYLDCLAYYLNFMYNMQSI